MILYHSTTNKTIDSAFVDRADIVQFIDLPTREAMYEILRTCLCEVIAKGVVAAVVSSCYRHLFEPLTVAYSKFPP